MTYSPGPRRLTPEARRVLVAIHDLSPERQDLLRRLLDDVEAA